MIVTACNHSSYDNLATFSDHINPTEFFKNMSVDFLDVVDMENKSSLRPVYRTLIEVGEGVINLRIMYIIL